MSEVIGEKSNLDNFYDFVKGMYVTGVDTPIALGDYLGRISGREEVRSSIPLCSTNLY